MERIESLLERPKFYNNIDGVGEMGMGVMILGFALLTWLQAYAPSDSLWHSVYVVLPLILLLAALIDRVSKAIKRRVTYPRTGYVAYQKRDRIWPAAIAYVVAGVAVAGLAFAAKLRWEIGHRWGLTTPVALVGLAFAAAYAYGVARAVRWKWAVAGLIAVCSVIFAMLPSDWGAAIVGDPSNAGPFMPINVGAWILSVLSYGVMLLISGGISFALYLRHTPRPEQAANEPAYSKDCGDRSRDS